MTTKSATLKYPGSNRRRNGNVFRLAMKALLFGPVPNRDRFPRGSRECTTRSVRTRQTKETALFVRLASCIGANSSRIRHALKPTKPIISRDTITFESAAGSTRKGGIFCSLCSYGSRYFYCNLLRKFQPKNQKKEVMMWWYTGCEDVEDMVQTKRIKTRREDRLLISD